MAIQIPNYVLLEETAKHIVNLESRRTKLLHEVHQVERELLAAQARHGTLTNQTAPVAMLPIEILSQIFLLCHGTEVTISRVVHRPFEVVASHVSTHWRSVVLGTPLLWNSINLHITHRTQAQALQRLSAHLIRSDRSLLDISLQIAVNDNIPELLQYLTPHAHRWHRVSISSQRGAAEDIYAPLEALSTPNLIHLSLRVGNSEDNMGAPRTEYPETCPTILTQGSPSLTFVRVAGKIVGNMSPPLARIRTLHVDAWPRNLMNLPQFHTLLNSLPCLIHLSLTGLSVQLPRDPLQTTQPITLHTLQSLRIRGNATPCHRLFSLLVLPHLESLLLQGVETFDSPTISTLHSLTLDTCSLSSTELQNLLRAFPRVAVLEVDDSTPEIYDMLMPEAGPSSMVPWPGLRSISLRRLPPTDVFAFTHMCLRRLDRGSPLQCVYLDRRSRNVLKAKELLDGLRELQTVDNTNDHSSWPADLGYDDPDDAWY